MAKSFLTEYRLELSSFLTLAFGFLSVVGLVGLYSDAMGITTFLEPLISPFGRWITWLGIIAPIALIVSAWWLYDYISKVRKLRKLIDTPSKAKFVKNIDDIDYLAWNLPRRFEVMVFEKKKELKI